MKRFVSALFLLFTLSVNSQLLIENFNTSFPVGWQQSPAASWSLSSLGVSGSSCAITQNSGSAPGVITLLTPTLNMTGVTGVTVSFNAAVVKNNFLIPDVVLSYEAGSGPQFLARWGCGFTANTTYTFSSDEADYVPPLDSQYVVWEACTHTLSTVSGNTVSFVFDADLYNGGYVLLDNIRIAWTSTAVATAMPDQAQEAEVLLFQNPVTAKQLQLRGNLVERLQIYNQLGQVVHTRDALPGETIREADLSALSAGAYYMSVWMENAQFLHKKIIVE